jgi:hypothetical protein
MVGVNAVAANLQSTNAQSINAARTKLDNMISNPEKGTKFIDSLPVGMKDANGSIKSDFLPMVTKAVEGARAEGEFGIKTGLNKLDGPEEFGKAFVAIKMALGNINMATELDAPIDAAKVAAQGKANANTSNVEKSILGALMGYGIGIAAAVVTGGGAAVIFAGVAGGAAGIHLPDTGLGEMWDKGIDKLSKLMDGDDKPGTLTESMSEGDLLVTSDKGTRRILSESFPALKEAGLLKQNEDGSYSLTDKAKGNTKIMDNLIAASKGNKSWIASDGNLDVTEVDKFISDVQSAIEPKELNEVSTTSNKILLDEWDNNQMATEAWGLLNSRNTKGTDISTLFGNVPDDKRTSFIKLLINHEKSGAIDYSGGVLNLGSDETFIRGHVSLVPNGDNFSLTLHGTYKVPIPISSDEAQNILKATNAQISSWIDDRSSIQPKTLGQQISGRQALSFSEFNALSVDEKAVVAKNLGKEISDLSNKNEYDTAVNSKQVSVRDVWVDSSDKDSAIYKALSDGQYGAITDAMIELDNAGDNKSMDAAFERISELGIKIGDKTISKGTQVITISPQAQAKMNSMGIKIDEQGILAGVAEFSSQNLFTHGFSGFKTEGIHITLSDSGDLYIFSENDNDTADKGIITSLNSGNVFTLQGTIERK